jgi:hypothetical protein
MSKLVLIGLVMTILSCYPNRGNVIYPLTKRDLLRFLNSKDWTLHQICVNGNCKEITDEDTPTFGIDTEKVFTNYCTSEKGNFYIIGKYCWLLDPETFEMYTTVLSCPDYFSISEFANNENETKIKLCTPDGYYLGTLKIIDATTIQIITSRPDYEEQQVIQVYKKKYEAPKHLPKP